MIVRSAAFAEPEISVTDGHDPSDTQYLDPAPTDTVGAGADDLQTLPPCRRVAIGCPAVYVTAMASRHA